MGKIHVFIFHGALAIGVGSCSSPQVLFQSNEDVVLTSKKLGEFNDRGEILKANQPIAADALKDKMVQISIKDRPPYYWILYQRSYGDLTVKVDSPDFVAPQAKSDPAIVRNPNILPRLVFLSLRALDDGDFKLTNELADQMNSSQPDLAMPWVIKGLVKINEGKKADALALFMRAKALDPTDVEIDKMIGSLKN